MCLDMNYIKRKYIYLLMTHSFILWHLIKITFSVYVPHKWKNLQFHKSTNTEQLNFARVHSCSLLCLQMSQGLVHGGSTPAFLHATNVPQQSTVGYIQQQSQTQQLPLTQQQQPQQQQRQYQHSQNQTGSVSDFRNMLTR